MEMETRTPTVVVRPEEIRGAVVAALVDAGACEADAAVQAEQLLEAELRGHPSHGIRRVAVLAGRLRAGLIVSGVAPGIEWTSASCLAVDGNLAFGPVAAHAALDELLPRAEETGAAVASVRRSHHIGMLAPYVERIAAAGCVALVLSTSEGLVHPWGGAGALVGTNPIGIGVPAGSTPLVLDMSTATASMGKILDYAARGQELPLGWAVDEDGRPTTDAPSAIRGAISPFGGAKGYALGISVAAIVGLLSGTAFGQEVTGTLDTRHPTTKGDLFMAISTRAFGALIDEQALLSYFETVRSSGIDGGRVGIPGDRARTLRRERLADGIPVDTQLWQDLLELGTGQTR
jgi:L-2-hydroxycarboxylate dehydrogenase (NAD+)